MSRRIVTWAGCVAAAVSAVVATGCGSGAAGTPAGDASANDAVVSAVLPAQADTESASETSTLAAPVQIVTTGNDPSGPACSALTVQQVEAATGGQVVGIRGNQDDAGGHRYSCQWKLAATAECDCRAVQITAIFHSNGVQIPAIRKYLDSRVAGGQLTPVPGVGDDAGVETQGKGLSSSVYAVQGPVDVTLQVRLAYSYVSQDSDAAVALAKLAMPHLALTS